MALKRDKSELYWGFWRDWPADAPMSARDFHRMRHATLYQGDSTYWDNFVAHRLPSPSYAEVLSRFSLSALQWAAQYNRNLPHRLPLGLALRLREHQQALDTLVQLAAKVNGNPQEIPQVVDEYKKRLWAAQEEQDRRRSFWFRLTFAVIMSGLTMAFFAFANYSPQLFQKHHVWPIPAAAYPDLLAIFLVIALLYFWRINYWQPANLTEYAIGMAVGLCAAVVFWHHGFPSSPYWSPAKAWGEALTGGLLVAIWVSHHVYNAVQDGDFVNLVAILLVAAPIVAILALI